MKNVFDINDSEELIARIDQLTTHTVNQWGKMHVNHMLAHCNVTYDMVYTDKYPKPKGFTKWMLKTFIKPKVINTKIYAHNSRTAPQFVITNEPNFENEKENLIQHIRNTQKLGVEHFEGKESHSFGKLTSKQWNNMFYKHLDHHLRQFGV